MKRLIISLVLTFLLLGTFACASSESGAPAPAPAPAPPPVINIPAPAQGVGVPSAPSPKPAPTPRPSPAPSGGDFEESWAVERMIVRTGEMQLVVTDVLAAVEQITALATSYDGYVVSSNSWRDGDRLVGSISIRVVAERFDDAIRALRSMSVEVNYENTTSVDVTEEYVDLSARLDNLEATKVQLEKLLEKTEEKVTDILEVQRELSRVTGEIEQTKGRMQYLEKTSSMSLINVQLQQATLDVNFTASSRTVKRGQDVRFEPSIGGGVSPYSYEWDFGDGTTSTDVLPTHSYKSEGSYNVILKVTDDKGQTSSRERNNYIEVLPGWSAGNVTGSAWNGLVTFGHVVANILIWLGIFSPVWIVIGVILYFTWWRRRKKKV